MKNEIIFTKKNNNKDNNQKEDKLLQAYNLIKLDIKDFKSKTTKKGFYFNIKLNEKTKKIKLFITLINNSDTNIRNEEIIFLIVASDEYPDKPPKVFCLSSVKFIINI